MSKGDRRIKEAKPGSYAEGADRIWPEPPKYCPGCGLLPSWCACTEDGPGQDEASKEWGKEWAENCDAARLAYKEFLSHHPSAFHSQASAFIWGWCHAKGLAPGGGAP